MQNPNHRMIPDDEIDFASIGSRISALLSYPFRLLFANPKTTLLFIVMAVLLSISIKLTVPKTYRSSFIIRPTDARDKLHLKMLDDIPAMLTKANIGLFAAALELSAADAASITRIEIENSSTGKKLIDSLNCTQVTITTTDYNQFIPVQNGIIAYLEHNPYYARQKKIQAEQQDLSLKQVEKDLAQLDSLKSLQLKNYGKQSPGGQNALLLSDVVNPTAAYALAVERNDARLNILWGKAFLDRFQLIKACIVNRQPSWPPRIMVLCLYTIPLFLLLCFVFLVIKGIVASKKHE